MVSFTIDFDKNTLEQMINQGIDSYYVEEVRNKAGVLTAVKLTIEPTECTVFNIDGTKQEE